MYFIKTKHFKQRIYERQVSETLVYMVERNLSSDIAFLLHGLCYEEEKILVTPPSYFIPNPYRPYLVLVRKKKCLITAYWVCLEKFIKIQMQEPCFVLNLENPDENSSYIIL